jgi:hypothetical protein
MSFQLSFRMSFHQAQLGPTGVHSPDNPTDPSCKDSTRQHIVDGPLRPVNSRLGVRVPPAPNTAGYGPAVGASLGLLRVTCPYAT